MNNTQFCPIKVISFDLDDALYDNQPVIERAEELSARYLRQAFAAESQVYEQAQFVQIKQQLLNQQQQEFENFNVLRQAVLQQLCTPLRNHQQVAAQAFDIFNHARNQVSVPAPIIQMLQLLANKFQLVSVSNGTCDISLSAIGGYFSGHYSPLKGFRAKPHPQMLQQILLDYELHNNQLLHVGDSLEKDAVAAQQAEVEFCHFAPFEGDLSIEHYKQRLFQCLGI